MNRGVLILIATTAILPAVVTMRAAQLATTSSAGPGSISAGGNSFGPVFSADGQRVTFVSHAGNLVTNETLRESLQVFVRDLVASNTVLISVGTNGRGGNANSFGPAISSNGQFVAFASEANDLVAGDTNGSQDVFVRDLISRMTRLVSITTNGTAPFDAAPGNVNNPLSGKPMISADGRWVFFESRATNLTRYADDNSTTDVFVRDLQSNSNSLLSLYFLVNRAANGKSELASITPRGERVAFISTATDLVLGGGNPLGDVYVRDLDTRTTYRASASLTNYTSSYKCLDAELSEDGRFVAFTASMDVQRTWLFRFDLTTGTNILVATNLVQRSRPQISADGRYVLFEDGTNMFRFDANTGASELVNVTTTGSPPVSGIARNPVATPDGNGITFISNCPDLVTNTSALFQIYARDMAASITRLVTVATNDKPSATNSEVSLLAVARDFSRVTFDSTAADLVEGDGNRTSDVFVRELTGQTTSLVSQRETSRPRGSGLAHSFIWNDCVSADGRFVAFASFDNDLLPGDANARPDVFVRDMLTGIIVTTGFSTNAARSPAISGNGRYVVYLRRSPVYAFQTTGGDVFRFDRETGTNEFVAQTSPFSGSPSSTGPVISSNGNFIAFLSSGNLMVRDMTRTTNETIAPADSLANRDALFTPDGRFVVFASTSALATNAGTFSRNLYAWDRAQGTIQLVSQYQNQDVSVGGLVGLSGNSRFVAFNNNYYTSATLYLRDLIVGTNQLLQSGATKPALNGDGTLIVFVSSSYGLRALNTATGEEPIVMDYGGALNAPLLSANGRFVVYSRRWVLTGTGVDYVSQLYMHDRTLGTTTLLSTGLGGTNANAQVWQPVLAADGRTLAFHSTASDFVAGDYNDKSDIFVLKLGVADTDGDGMDDDWEVAYFGNLSRNGLGDFDGDGASDVAEFLAGTDPMNSGSVFRVLTVTPAGGGSTQLIWSGSPNRSYRAEFKDDLSGANWAAVSGTISWNGSTASIIDTTAANSTHRYYRVVRLP